MASHIMAHLDCSAITYICIFKSLKLHCYISRIKTRHKCNW